MGTPLTLERCAEMRAEMEAGRLRDEVLGCAGLSAEDWTTAQHEWLDKMGAELKRSRFELTNRYTAAFLERQRELAARRPAARDAPALMEAPAAEEAVTAPMPPIVLPPPAPPFALDAPSPWSGEPAPKARSPWDETETPAVSPPAAPPPLVPPPAPSQPVGSSLAGTVVGTLSPFAVGAVLPFARDPAPAPSSAVVSPAPAAPPPRPAMRPSTPGMAAVKPLDPALGGTVMGSTVSPFATSASLPFMKAPDAPPPPSAPTAVVAFAPVPAAPVPPAPVPAAGPSGGLTLEQHASLCAELAFNPALADETLGLYHVTPAGKAELDQSWWARFAAEPALEAKWRESYRIYFGFLTSARRR